MVRNNKGACGGANRITNRAPVYRPRVEWLMRAMGFAPLFNRLMPLTAISCNKGQLMVRTGAGGVSLVG